MVTPQVVPLAGASGFCTLCDTKVSNHGLGECLRAFGCNYCDVGILATVRRLRFGLLGVSGVGPAAATLTLCDITGR